jgi:opacity protein-like surface antigen
MRFSIKQAVMATSLLTASVAPAMAQLAPPAVNWSGFYIGGFVGGATGSTVQSNDPVIVGGPFAGTFYNGAPPPGNYSYNAHGSWIGGFTAGFNWQPVGSPWLLGLEGEVGSMKLNGGGQVDPFNVAVAGADSTVNTHTGSWYGLVTGRVGITTGNLLFYGKGGVGFTDYSTSYVDACGTAPCGPLFLNASASKTDIFPVGGGGLEYSINPNWSVKAEYLWMGVNTSVTGCGNPSNFAGPLNLGGGAYCQTSHLVSGSNTVKFGFNYHFAPPPPPPPAPMAAPMPPPAAPKVFIVFFDWDRDTITAEGHAIIQQAADAYKSGAPVQIQVTGYTDRSGSAGYNQRLSERRANNVARALAALGVPREQMAVSGRGENDNRVPTADGVREPQNRRVEIVTP